jgi:hypothetical protein
VGVRLLVVGGSDAGIAAALRARELAGRTGACTPPFGSPWDAIQLAARDWARYSTRMSKLT